MTPPGLIRAGSARMRVKLVVGYIVSVRKEGERRRGGMAKADHVLLMILLAPTPIAVLITLSAHDSEFLPAPWLATLDITVAILCAIVIARQVTSTLRLWGVFAVCATAVAAVGVWGSGWAITASWAMVILSGYAAFSPTTPPIGRRVHTCHDLFAARSCRALRGLGVRFFQCDGNGHLRGGGRGDALSGGLGRLTGTGHVAGGHRQ